MKCKQAHPCGPNAPSPWVVRFAPLIRAEGAVLDVAAGAGRHSRLFLELGHPVTAIDRDTSMLAPASGFEIIKADLEGLDPWPLPGRHFAAIVVTNYLFRLLWPHLLDSLDETGILIYETFSEGHERLSATRPRNPDHLLRSGELLEVVRGKLSVIAFEQGIVQRDKGPAVVQRLCAARGPGPHVVNPPGD
ncbi:MAG: class I SAM-dependent methyltransferase [Alphaproteobacteria bacterium]|nr:class I SAM-dependent methyltransferase [Alphaproteobacteria bacterium]